MSGSESLKDKISVASKVLGIEEERLSDILADNSYTGMESLPQEEPVEESQKDISKEAQRVETGSENTVSKVRTKERLRLCSVCGKSYVAHSYCCWCKIKADEIPDELFGFLDYVRKKDKKFSLDNQRKIANAVKLGEAEIAKVFPELYEEYKSKKS